MPADPHREHEAKFAVSASLLPSLVSNEHPLTGYSKHTIGTLTQVDTYMDTPSFDLLRHGLALRIRHNGSAYEAGIKSIESTGKGTIHNRMDVTIPLPAEAEPFDATTWPESVEEQLGDSTANFAEIRPILVVRQQRRKAHVAHQASNREIAEWSLDDLWISAPAEHLKVKKGNEIAAQSGGSEGKEADFHELEIEWLQPAGSDEASQEVDDAFTDLVAQVQSLYELEPVYTSKLVRGLEQALAYSHNNRTLMSPEMELEAAGRLLLHQQLLQINLNEHGVRNSKSAKYVHEMRVAVRRALAAMEMCQSTIPEERLAPYEKGLKRIGRALGAVRDLDVAMANLRTFGRDLPENQRNALKKVRSTMKVRRKHSREELVALLDSKKHRKFLVAFDDFCTTQIETVVPVEESSGQYHPSQVRHTIPSLITGAFEAVRCYEVAFYGGSLPSLDTFHALRKQGKYLRYLLEFTVHLLGRDGATLITQVQGLQEHLGELNDARVEQERIHEWAEKLPKDEDLRRALEARLEQVATRIDELRAATPARLEKFVSAATRRKLASALATI